MRVWVTLLREFGAQLWTAVCPACLFFSLICVFERERVKTHGACCSRASPLRAQIHVGNAGSLLFNDKYRSLPSCYMSVPWQVGWGVLSVPVAGVSPWIPPVAAAWPGQSVNVNCTHTHEWMCPTLPSSMQCLPVLWGPEDTHPSLQLQQDPGQGSSSGALTTQCLSVKAISAG